MDSKGMSDDSFVVLDPNEDETVGVYDVHSRSKESSLSSSGGGVEPPIGHLSNMNRLRISASQPNGMNNDQQMDSSSGGGGGPTDPRANYSESMPCQRIGDYDMQVIGEYSKEPDTGGKEPGSIGARSTSSAVNYSFLDSHSPASPPTDQADYANPMGAGRPSNSRLAGSPFKHGDVDEAEEDVVQSLEWMEEAQLLQVLECLTAVRKENEHLTKVLQANNAVMKRNMDSLQGQKQELSMSRSAMEQLKEDSNRAIEQLKAENVQLMERYKQVSDNQCQHGISYDKLDVSHELELQKLTSDVVEKERELNSLNNDVNQLKRQLSGQDQEIHTVADLRTQLEYFMNKAKVEEAARVEASRERAELELVCQKLVEEKRELEERLEKGPPVIDLGSKKRDIGDRGQGSPEDAEEEPEAGAIGGHHHRRHHRRHHGHRRHHCSSIEKNLQQVHERLNKKMKETLPLLSKGLFLQSFKQFKG